MKTGKNSDQRLQHIVNAYLLKEVEFAVDPSIVQDIVQSIADQLRFLTELTPNDARYYDVAKRILEETPLRVPSAESVAYTIANHFSDQAIIEWFQKHQDRLAEDDPWRRLFAAYEALGISRISSITNDQRTKRAEIYNDLHALMTDTKYKTGLEDKGMYDLYERHPQLREIANRYAYTYCYPYDPDSDSSTREESPDTFNASELPDDICKQLQQIYMLEDWEYNKKRYTDHVRIGIHRILDLDKGSATDDTTPQHGQSPARFDGTIHTTPQKGNTRVVS